jgi:hypothetical protein
MIIQHYKIFLINNNILKTEFYVMKEFLDLVLYQLVVYIQQRFDQNENDDPLIKYLIRDHDQL